MKKIAVLIDFTSICETAIAHAALIVRHTYSPLMLVNIVDPAKAADEKLIKEQMKSHAHLLDKEDIPYALRVGYGEFFSTIHTFLDEIGAEFVVVGTHGIKGIANASYGLNILRLINSLHLPTLVVQGHSELPLEGYENILIPVLNSAKPIRNVQAMAIFGQLFKAKMIVLHFVQNQEMATEARGVFLEQFNQFDQEIAYDVEEISPYVHTFARSILQYANIEDVNLLIHTEQSGDMKLTTEDQENLILNRHGIAVLHLPTQ
jgi:nucleotide-binding universal stress UspA family protein